MKKNITPDTITKSSHLAEFKHIIKNWVNAPKQPDIVFPADIEDDPETYEEAEYGELRSSCILPKTVNSLKQNPPEPEIIFSLNGKS